MGNLAKLVEKAKRNTGNMELLIERFTPLIRYLAHRLPYEYQDAEQDMKLTSCASFRFGWDNCYYALYLATAGCTAIYKGIYLDMCL